MTDLCQLRSRRRLPGSRAGFTLVELLIGSLVASIVIVVAFQVLVGEQRSAEARRQEMNAQQNLRVALDGLTRDIRMAGFGVDVFGNQPRVVDAGPWQVAFNGDISTGVGGEPAMDATMEIKLSGGTVYSPGDFPSENLNGEPRYAGGAETVVLGLDGNGDGLVNDSDLYDLSDCPNDYALYRGINGLRTERLAFGVRGPEAYPDGTLPPPLFRYWGDFGGAGLRLWGDTNNDGELSQTEISNLDPVSVGELQNVLYVDVEVGAFSAGSVLQSAHAHGTEADPFKYLEVSTGTRVRPRNLGVNPTNMSACGDRPTRPGNVWVQDTPDDAGSSITIHFNASVDEAGGEEDVTHYFIYRREAGGIYGGAIASVPAAGDASYSYANDLHTPDEENIPVDGVQYYYRVTAWDCAPQESQMSYEVGPAVSQPNGSAPPVLVQAFDTPCDEGGEITLIFNQSPDEGAGLVSGYRVFRGPTGGDFLAKTLIGFMASSGAASYTFRDNDANNVAGAPPVDGQPYWYTVRAVNDTIVSVDSNELGPVDANDGLSAALLEAIQDVPFDDGSRLNVSWLRSESENCSPNPVLGYRLQRKDPLSESFANLSFYAVTGDPAYAAEDSGLLAGQPYVYRVLTVSADEERPSNDMQGVPTNNIDLLPPTNLTASGVPCDASGAIQLAWDRSFHDNGSGDVEWYRIWRRVQGSGVWGELDRVPAIGASDYDYADNSSSPSPPVIGLTYEYVVTAYNDTHGNESGHSVMATCTSASVPDSPYLWQATDTLNDHGGSITVRFNRSDDDGSCTDTVVSYAIYRQTDWGGWGDEHWVGNVTATNSGSYTFVDNGSQAAAPIDGTGYYYMVRAWDGTQFSVNSNVRGPAIAVDDGTTTATIFTDGFESNMGWTHGGNEDDWQRGDPVARAQTYGRPDPENAYLGANVYGTDIGGSGYNGTYRPNANSWLMSPAINCTGYESVQLAFTRWLNVEQPLYDRAIVELSVSGSGGPWTELWRNSAEITDTSWQWMNFTLSGADNRPDVRIRFRLQSDDSWHYAGWNIDEVHVIGEH